MRRAVPILLACLALSCAASRTEVILVVDSDLDVPGDLDRVEVEVVSPTGDRQSATAALTGDNPALPRTLGLVHESGPLGPFTATISAMSGGSAVVSREARFTFQPGRTLALEVDLLQECVGMGCGGDETCAAGGCRSTTVEPDELSEWNGMGGGGGPGGCDGVDTDTDPRNCGSCGNVCSVANGTAGCAGGECTVASCDADFDDCNDDASDGCEADLGSDDHCGSCDNDCGGPTMCCPDQTCGRRC